MEDKITQDIKLNFEALFHGLPGLFVVLSPDLTILTASTSYLNSTNKILHEIVGNNLFEVFPSENASSDLSSDPLYVSLQYVLTQKEPHTIPLTRYDIKSANQRAKRTAGTYWNIINTPVFSDKKNLLYIVQEVRNITHQVQEEEQVKTSHASLRLMAKIVGGAIWEYDILNKKFTWSESYKNLFGYSDEDLEVEPGDWSLRVHPDDIVQTRNEINNVIKRREKTWTGEYRYLRADGSYADVLDHGYILYDTAGKPVRMLGSMIDLSKQKDYERELQVSNERFEMVAKATNDVIWDWSLLDDTIWWNDGYQKLFGYDEEKRLLDLESWMAHVHPSDLQDTENSIQNAINGSEDTWTAIYRFMCKDGTYKLIQDKGYVVRDEEGQAVRMIGAMVDITGKQEVEQKLQESNNRTKQVLESLPLMTWTAEPGGAVTYYSESWHEFTGATYQQLQDWGWSTVMHPDDLESMVVQWEKALLTEQNYEVEGRVLSKNGTYRWFLMRAVPIRNSIGNVSMWVGSNTDIEEHKKLLLSLQESNRRTQFLAETIPDIVWSANSDGSADYFNKCWYQVTGLSEAKSLGWGWGAGVHPDDLQLSIDSWLHSMQTGETFQLELRMRDAFTDNYRWFLARALPMRNDNGEIVKWFGTATDIHDYKLLNQQLKESNKQFQFLAETIPQILWTTDANGFLEYFNQRWTDYTGFTLEESKGFVWAELLHPEDYQRCMERWQHSLKTGEYYEIEYRFKNGNDGTYRWFLGQAMPMRNSKGEVVKWFGTLTDIEDHKVAEEELVEKNLELKRINQDLDSFVYTASHDLKLPIINMAGIFEELINTATFRDPDAPAMIHMFNKSLRQLHETIYDLSEVVRVQKQRERQLEQINLFELTEDVKLSIRDTLNETGANIIVDFSLAPTIPFTRSSLKSIFYNLINNAIKYRDSYRVPEIRISSTQKGDFIELKVSDNGIGIDMNKHHNKLFQMFKRFHNHVPGSGLGLYIVNRLLTNHGGYINIESKLDEGTTFYLYFKDINS